jgi:two-component system nitrate/nitrite response regulator NarL
VQVLVADDHPLIRHGLICLLAQNFSDWSFLQAGNLAQATRLLADRGTLGPIDLLVLDPAIAVIDPCTTIRHLRNTYPATRIIVLASRADPVTILASFEAGAQACLLKTDPAETLLDTIRSVLGGHVRAPLHLTLAAAQPSRLASLTTRQREVLKLLVDGRSTKDIARSLNLGLGTVKVHLNGVYQRLGARNRGEAVACFRQLQVG